MQLREVLRTPGVAGPMAGSLLGMLPVTALGLLLILHVEELTGDFAPAGLAAAAYALGLGVSAPVVGRQIDRRGQVRVLLVLTAVVVAALAALAVLPASAPTGAVVALAAVTGLAMPPGGANVRALWTTALPDADRRHAVFALHSAGVELAYVLGPAVIAGGVGTVNSRAALLLSAALLVLGIAVYVSRPVVRTWQGDPAGGGGFLGPIAAPAVRWVLATLFSVGIAFGSIEVGVAAIADAADARGAAGLLLGSWGLGSMAGALVLARLPAPHDQPRALALRLTALAGAHVLLLVSTDPAVLAPLMLVAGGLIAPALIGALALLGEVAPPGALTEAYSWSTCGIAGGLAAGAGLGGVLAEQTARGPFVQGVVAIALGALVATTFRRRIRRQTPRSYAAK